jgi:hypothetical protein
VLGAGANGHTCREGGDDGAGLLACPQSVAWRSLLSSRLAILPLPSAGGEALQDRRLDAAGGQIARGRPTFGADPARRARYHAPAQLLDFSF